MKRLDVAEAREIPATVSAVDVHVGGRIAELRLSRSISVSTLAEHLAVPPTVIAEWESGRERVPASSLIVVVEYFSCHLEDIFDGLFDPAAVGDIVI